MNFDDWYLVFNGGQTLVGKYADDTIVGAPGFAPVYVLHTSVRTDAGGRGVGVVRHMSLPDFIDIPFITFPCKPPCTPITSLSPSVQRELANGIEMAEEMRTKIRAAESGLVVP